MSADRPARSLGYLTLLRRQRTFRLIWLSNVVSLMGDWFCTISLFSMILEFTGSGSAVGMAFVSRLLPALVFGPLSGVVADRLPRKQVMLVCNLLRALIVAGFVLVHDKEQLGFVYLLSFAQLAVSCFFGPAEQAVVASCVRRDEVVTAQALHGITWSAMLMIGAMVGGLFAELAGREACFLLNSITYLLSALCVLRAEVSFTPPRPPSGRWQERWGLQDVVEGTRFVATDARARRVLAVKALWGLTFGGAMVLYNVFGDQVFRVGTTAATGIGLLYGARGVGALVGPTFARQFGDDDVPFLERAVGLSFPVLALCYLGFAAAPTVLLGAGALVLVHMAASTMSTFTTSLLNLWVPDRILGRVFAADGILSTVAQIASTLFVGWAMDAAGASPRVVMGILGALVLLPGLAWWLMPRDLSA